MAEEQKKPDDDIYNRILAKPDPASGLILAGAAKKEVQKDQAKLINRNKSDMEVKNFIDYQPDTNNIGLTFQVRVRRVPCDDKGNVMRNVPFPPWIMLPAYGLYLRDLKRIVGEMEVDANKNRPDWVVKYYEQHTCCPTCGHFFDSITATEPVKWLGQLETNMADPTMFHCICGWKGTVHQMKAKA